MSLTRYLPTPSDRMGILWNLLSVRESIVLEYGPAGTTHFSMSLYGELGVDQENRLFTTHMSEDDVVMGDVSRLEHALLELDEAYAPKVIFVVGSSIAAVIGTDIKGVCSYMQQRVNARLIAFDQGGFRGDYSFGCSLVWQQLAQLFPKAPVEKCSGTYNLLGVSAGSYRIRSDVWELQNLLREAFDLRMNTCFCLDTSVTELETAGCAELNLVLRPEAGACANTLRERFGTPAIHGTPYGYAASISWLQRIGEVLGREPDEHLMARLREKAGKTAMYHMYGRMLKKDRPLAALAGEYHTITGIGNFLEGLGITPKLQICLHSLKAVPEALPAVTCPGSEGERLALLRQCHRQLVLGDDISLRQLPANNVCGRIASPVICGAQTANHLPLVGEKGADFMLEWVEEYFQMVQ